MDKEVTLEKLDAVFKEFLAFIKIESDINSDLTEFLVYVIDGYDFFKEYNLTKQDNGFLYISSLGREISRYASEFYWGNAAWEKVSYYTEMIYEYIQELNKTEN